MKKYAFSVWPGVDQDPPRQSLIAIRNYSVKVLEADGWEVGLQSRFDEFDKYSTALFSKFKNPVTVKDYTNYSDYVRLITLREKLETYDEVMYFDYDLFILEAPTGFGCAVEIHFSNDENSPDINKTDKFWFRGVNCTINLNKSHIPILDAHIFEIQEDIIKNNGKPKHCYPMNYMWRIEEQIGYIPGYYLFGSLEEPGYCTEEKILLSVETMVALFGEEHGKISAVNLMGSRKDDFVKIAIAFEELSGKIGTSDKGDSFIKRVIRKTSKPIRVNYGASLIRDRVKNWVQEEPSLFQ